ncbi:MAG: D-alanine--D-alanine ligase [Candidatus Saccharimonadales bacterium]
MGQKSRAAIYTVLASHFSEVGITIVNDLTDLEDLVTDKPDLVFLGMKYVPGELNNNHLGSNKIWLSEYLDEHNIAYTGSTHSAHELELDKSLTKECVIAAGLNTSSYIVARRTKLLTPQNVTLKFPVFIKPTDRGGGTGVDSASLANNFDELLTKVKSIRSELGADSLIEEYLPGREFSVAIIKEKFTNKYLAMPLELVAPANINGDRFLSAAIKSADTETFKAVAEGDVRDQVTSLAIKAFRALGARDYGRIDIRFDKSGTAHFLEANLIPSLIKDYGNFPKACKINLQMDYEAMLLHIVDLALTRSSYLRTQHSLAEPRLTDLTPYGVTYRYNRISTK